MDSVLTLLGAGLLEALQPLNLLMIVIGCTVGLLVGAMPGLGSVNGVAILLPITFLVPPTAAIIFLAAIYYGAMYGGAISSITLGIYRRHHLRHSIHFVCTTAGGVCTEVRAAGRICVNDARVCHLHWIGW